jgi:hypothetical protein
VPANNDKTAVQARELRLVGRRSDRRWLPGTLLGAMLLASCSTSAPIAPISPAQAAANQALANRVYLALNADPVYFFRHVNVSADNGVVHLSGYVWTADAIYQARNIARHVPGVTRVASNHLEIELEGRGNGVTR